MVLPMTQVRGKQAISHLLEEQRDTEIEVRPRSVGGASSWVRKADWAEFVPAMRSKVVRFEVVDEDEWQARLNGMLFGGAA